MSGIIKSCFDAITETDFLRETAWVILSAGMREAVIRSKFGSLTEAFRGWRSASEVTRHEGECRTAAMAIFSHQRKIDAICNVARRVTGEGFPSIKSAIRQQGLEYLETLAFIGPITRYHLAKNIGLDMVKPDRHLVRIASIAGYQSPDEMCQVVSLATGDRLAVVDLVIWRYATLDDHYLCRFEASV